MPACCRFRKHRYRVIALVVLIGLVYIFVFKCNSYALAGITNGTFGFIRNRYHYHQTSSSHKDASGKWYLFVKALNQTHFFTKFALNNF